MPDGADMVLAPGLKDDFEGFGAVRVAFDVSVRVQFDGFACGRVGGRFDGESPQKLCDDTPLASFGKVNARADAAAGTRLGRESGCQR